MTDAPTGSNSDEWALFLSEWGTAYCAVRIAEAIEAAEQRGYARGIEAARTRLQLLRDDYAEVGEWGGCTALDDADEVLHALSPTPPDPVTPKVKPLVFDWTHEPTVNPSEHVTIGNGYSARVYIPYEKGNDPASGVGTWCGVAQQRGQSGFPSKEAATAYCEETIRDYAQAAVNGASNFLDMAPVTVQEAAIKDALQKLLDCMKAVDDEAERADQPGARAWSSAPVIAMKYAREQALRALAEREGE